MMNTTDTPHDAEEDEEGIVFTDEEEEGNGTTSNNHNHNHTVDEDIATNRLRRAARRKMYCSRKETTKQT